MSYIPCVVAVNVQFPKKFLMMTNAFITSGLGLGMMVGGPLLEALMDRYGWSGCLLICSALSLQGCVLWPLMRVPNGISETGTAIEGESFTLHWSSSDFELFNFPWMSANGCLRSETGPSRSLSILEESEIREAVSMSNETDRVRRRKKKMCYTLWC